MFLLAQNIHNITKIEILLANLAHLIAILVCTLMSLLVILAIQDLELYPTLMESMNASIRVILYVKNVTHPLAVLSVPNAELDISSMEQLAPNVPRPVRNALTLILVPNVKLRIIFTQITAAGLVRLLMGGE